MNYIQRFHSSHSQTAFSAAAETHYSTSTGVSPYQSTTTVEGRSTSLTTTKQTAKSRQTSSANTTPTRDRSTIGSTSVALKSVDIITSEFQSNGQLMISDGGGGSGGPDSEEGSGMGLLWLPYVVFSVVLLGLIAMSFVRFHCQRGDQYRRRRSELEDKVLSVSVNEKGGGGVLAASFQPKFNGASTVTATAKGPLGDVPEHMVLFLQFTEAEALPPSGPGSSSQDEQWSASKYPVGGSVRRVFGLKAQSKVPSYETTTTTTTTMAAAASLARSQSVMADAAPRHPLTFTFNINGSMVDVRCNDEERTKTFCLSATGTRTGTGTGYTEAPIVTGTDDDDDYRDVRRAPTAATTTTTTTLSCNNSSRRSSNSVRLHGYFKPGSGGRGGGGGGMRTTGCGGGAQISSTTTSSSQQRVLMYSLAAGTPNEVRKTGLAPDEAPFLLRSKRS